MPWWPLYILAPTLGSPVPVCNGRGVLDFRAMHRQALNLLPTGSRLSVVWGFCNDVSVTRVGRRSFQLSRELMCGTDPRDRAMRSKKTGVGASGGLNWLSVQLKLKKKKEVTLSKKSKCSGIITRPGLGALSGSATILSQTSLPPPWVCFLFLVMSLRSFV